MLFWGIILVDSLHTPGKFWEKSGKYTPLPIWGCMNFWLDSQNFHLEKLIWKYLYKNDQKSTPENVLKLERFSTPLGASIPIFDGAGSRNGLPPYPSHSSPSSTFKPLVLCSPYLFLWPTSLSISVQLRWFSLYFHVANVFLFLAVLKSGI